jgi:hypothetical protein
MKWSLGDPVAGGGVWTSGRYIICVFDLRLELDNQTLYGRGDVLQVVRLKYGKMKIVRSMPLTARLYCSKVCR